MIGPVYEAAYMDCGSKMKMRIQLKDFIHYGQYNG
jgi:hypothetical protein